MKKGGSALKLIRLLLFINSGIASLRPGFCLCYKFSSESFLFCPLSGIVWSKIACTTRRTAGSSFP